MPAVRTLVSLVLVLAVALVSCSGTAPADSTSPVGPYDRAAADYAASAMRAVDGTAFEILDAAALADLVVGLCEGLGVGAIGVAAADTGIDAPSADVAIFLEVLRTGLDQVCEERVAIDFTSIYLDAIRTAVSNADAADVYDEIDVIRAAPVACQALATGVGGEAALVAAIEELFGGSSFSDGELDLGTDQALVAGAVLAASVALLCPERLGEIEEVVGP